jgi:hypothetical protein
MMPESLPKAEKDISSHLTSARPQAPATFVLREASLKAFLGLRSASAWSRQAGNSETLKGAEASRSVRAAVFFFMRAMEDFHSLLVVGGAVSHFGRRLSSSSSAFCCAAGTPSWRTKAHWSLA